jgi:hypothetical protein
MTKGSFRGRASVTEDGQVLSSQFSVLRNATRTGELAVNVVQRNEARRDWAFDLSENWELRTASESFLQKKQSNAT